MMIRLRSKGAWAIITTAILILLVCFGVVEAAHPADYNDDKRIDFKDFALLANTNWNWEEIATLADNWLWAMAYIPANDLMNLFMMGDHFNEGRGDELPVHPLMIDQFYMGPCEVTNREYCEFLNSALAGGNITVTDGVVYGNTPHVDAYCDTYPEYSYSRIDWNGTEFAALPHKTDHPMVGVSWYGAAAYCNWLSESHGYDKCYEIVYGHWTCLFYKSGYRLPTEAEWEYAARGGQHSPYYKYPWGDGIDGSMANYFDSGDPYEGTPPETTPVGYYDGRQIPAGSDMANGYGLYDMAGNVWEWCNDWYAFDYYFSSPYNNPTGPISGTYRVLRGGCWYYYANDSRVAGRYDYFPDYRNYLFGFRIVLDFN